MAEGDRAFENSLDVAFVIAVSAPGVSYAELYQFVVANTLRSRGFSDREVWEATDALRRLDNFVKIREALRRAGNSRNMIKVFPGADHELMLAPDAGGGGQRSAEVNRERRIALDYLDTMTGWLREQLGLAR